MDKELLKRFFEGQATTDEEMRVREWMDASEENRRAYFRERKMYDMTLLLTDESEIKSAPQPTKKNVRFFIKFIEIAAVAVITLVVTLFYKNREEQNYWLTAQKSVLRQDNEYSLNFLMVPKYGLTLVLK